MPNASNTSVSAQLTTAPADRLDVHAGDPGQFSVASVSKPGGLDGDIPAALLLVEAAQQQIHPGVERLLKRLARLEAGGALALVNDWLRHPFGSPIPKFSPGEGV